MGDLKSENKAKRELLVALSDVLLWGVITWVCYVDKSIFVSGIATGFTILGFKRLVESYVVIHAWRRKKV